MSQKLREAFIKAIDAWLRDELFWMTSPESSHYMIYLNENNVYDKSKFFAHTFDIANKIYCALRDNNVSDETHSIQEKILINRAKPIFGYYFEFIETQRN